MMVFAKISLKLSIQRRFLMKQIYIFDSDSCLSPLSLRVAHSASISLRPSHFASPSATVIVSPAPSLSHH